MDARTALIGGLGVVGALVIVAITARATGGLAVTGVGLHE